jgi:beta-xylosidase
MVERRPGSLNGAVTGAVVLAMTLAALMVGGPTASAAGRPGRTNAPDPTLAYGGDFPDPFVLVAGGRYYAYSTQVGSPGHWTNVPVMSSTDLTTWTTITDALPNLPGWATPGNTWAPGVLLRGRTYVMYYTTTQSASGRQCVSTATASTPAGPFKDSSAGPLVCQLSLGGSIDPYPFVDDNGTPYLLWKSDNNAIGQATVLWSRQLSSNGLGFRFFSRPAQLLSEQPATWQAPAIEGPAMVRSAGTYYLFYGAGPWSSSGSGIGYAVCSSPIGPCVDRSTSAPWLSSSPALAAVGPQGPTVFTDLTGGLRLGFAGWSGGVGYQSGGVRSFWTGPLSFPGGQPALG